MCTCPVLPSSQWVAPNVTYKFWKWDLSTAFLSLWAHAAPMSSWAYLHCWTELITNLPSGTNWSLLLGSNKCVYSLWCSAQVFSETYPANICSHLDWFHQRILHISRENFPGPFLLSSSQAVLVTSLSQFPVCYEKILTLVLKMTMCPSFHHIMIREYDWLLHTSWYKITGKRGLLSTQRDDHKIKLSNLCCQSQVLTSTLKYGPWWAHEKV